MSRHKEAIMVDPDRLTEKEKREIERKAKEHRKKVAEERRRHKDKYGGKSPDDN